ncbi:unnamed protein product [Alternaria alternata]
MADEESSMGHRIPGDEDDTIYEMAESCENLLRSGRSALESYGSSISTLLEEYEQRFTAWADYLGVFAKRSISLDRRLQHHPDIQDLVVRLLDILKTNLTCYGFRDHEALSKHMRESHQFEETTIRAIVQQSNFTVTRQQGTCPICCLPIEQEFDSKLKKVAPRMMGTNDPRKRQSEPLTQTGTLKRAKMSYDQKDSGSQRISGSHTSTDNQQLEPDDVPTAVNMFDTDMMARHIASHLQNLAFLSIDLFSIRDYGEDDIDSVATQGPSGDEVTESENCTRRVQSNEDSIDYEIFYEESLKTDRLSDVGDDNESRNQRGMAEVEEVDWSDVILSKRKVDTRPGLDLRGLTRYDRVNKPTPLTPQARRIIQESFDSFENMVQQYSPTDNREFSNTTLRDVRDSAKEVERQLAARQCMRNMKRLELFLNGLEAYSKVVEVLFNGTPFLSWIWVSCDIELFGHGLC